MHTRKKLTDDARKLSRAAYLGLYCCGERFNDARPTKRGGIELRKIEGQWIPLLPSYQLTDHNGRPVANPIAAPAAGMEVAR